MMQQTLTEYVLDKIDIKPEVPKLKFKINVSNFNIRFKEVDLPTFSPTDGETYLDKLINDKFNYEISIDPLNKKLILDNNGVVDLVKREIGNDIRSLFKNVSYNKAPKMTKLYKSLYKMTVSYEIKKEKNDEMVKKMANILNYYEKVKTESELSIKDDKNSAHRKNLYSLLVLMEKKYGQAAKEI